LNQQLQSDLEAGQESELHLQQGKEHLAEELREAKGKVDGLLKQSALHEVGTPCDHAWCRLTYQDFSEHLLKWRCLRHSFMQSCEQLHIQSAIFFASSS
jgi:hypothetical protein